MKSSKMIQFLRLYQPGFSLSLAATIVCSVIIEMQVRCRVVTLNDFTDVKGNNAIREIRIMYSSNQTTPVRLTRGQPLFAEIDFVPKYFPTDMTGVSITVLIPETIRRSRIGGPWIIGWNQEKLNPPSCRLCTNNNQSYTIPVTIFLPDDGWCPEGPIPTGWKLEASLGMISADSDPGSSVLSSGSSNRLSNSDLIIGMVVDELAQIQVVNRAESSFCVGIQEAIRYKIPEAVLKTQLKANQNSTRHPANHNMESDDAFAKALSAMSKTTF